MPSFSWFVLRDLKRPNAKLPAYRFLSAEGLEVFTPMTWRLSVRGGKRVREERPFLPDLLFVHSTREALDPYVEELSTLQYRYVRGGYCRPMVVGDAEMERFIRAVRSTDSPRYYLPGELTPAMCGRTVRLRPRFEGPPPAGGNPQPDYGGHRGGPGIHTGDGVSP